MAIVEISRIQVRRGQELVTGTPNLSPGEFGWAQDTQNLYIGKSIAEGADSDAPTRVLTEVDLSNFFKLVGSIDSTATNNTVYTYRQGNEFLTHTSTSTVQRKLDSLNPTLYDFGVVSTSTTVDITQELKDAVRDLFRNEVIGPDWLGNDSKDLRRQLMIPPGTYTVSDTVELPPYTTIVGAGPDRTTIIFNNTITNLFQTIDLAGNDYDSNNMQSGLIRSRDIYLGNMTLQFSSSTSVNNCLLSLDNVTNARVENCVFKTDIEGRFDNISTTSYVLGSSSTVTLYTSVLEVNYFSSQPLIVSYDSDNFLRGEVVSYNTGTGELVISSDLATQQFGAGTYTNWTIKLDNYFTAYGFAVHGVGIQLRGSGGGTNGDVNLCQNITIKDCVFDGLKNGIQGYGSVDRIFIENSIFNNLESGIRFWSPDLIIPAPTNAYILRNKFESIIAEAVYVGPNVNNNPTNHVSEGNAYIRVANGTDLDDNVQANTSATSVLRFWAPGNKSINDYFSRRVASEETTDPFFYYFPLVNRHAMLKDDAIRLKTIASNAITEVTKVFLTDKDQKLDINYQMIGNGLSRKGTLLLNVAPDGYIGYTDYYNYSQTVQEVEQPFYITEPINSSTFTVARTTATSYMDQVTGSGNWYVVGKNNPDIGGLVVGVTTATSTGSPYSTGTQYYTFSLDPAPFIDLLVGTTTTSYDFAYSDFQQPTFNINENTIDTSTNWVSLEVISNSEFDMYLEFRTDQQL